MPPRKKYSTSTTLVIVESPAKCKKIESFLGPGYQCMASFGHLRELTALKHVDVANNFKPFYTVVDNALKKKQIDLLRTAIKKADDVILATDDDREGEAIAWHICQLFQLDHEKTKRIIFHEVTEKALQNAVESPTFINMNVVHAQQARQILDLLVGFKVSPILWKNITKNAEHSLSAGRCQTPALRLVYDNNKEITGNSGKYAYKTIGYFNIQKTITPFQLNTDFEKEEEIVEFLENSIDFNHIYNRSEPVKVSKTPPEPFTTSRLQQTASNEMHISPKETMQLCQILYEDGYITYMRTDSKKYSNEFTDRVTKYIEKNYDDTYVSKSLSVSNQAISKSKSKSLAQEAHEAIRPTDISLRQLPEKHDSKIKKLYKIIWENTLESCMSNATYFSIQATVTTCNADAKYMLTSELIDFPGWKIVKNKKSDADENLEYQHLLHMKSNSIAQCNKISSKVFMKEQKLHYTEARLVQLLEEKGIGRPSTFAMILEKIQERGYVKKQDVKGKNIMCKDYEMENNDVFEVETQREFGNEKNKLVIQQLGIVVMEFLDSHFNDLFNYDYTKNMEDDLDKIVNGDKLLSELCDDCFTKIEGLIANLDDVNDVNKNKNKCEYKIDENHTYMIGKYGPVIRGQDGDGGAVNFKNVKEMDIDIEKMKRGEYKLEDLVNLVKPQVNTNSSNNNNNNNKTAVSLGMYEGEDLFVKTGKFGLYTEWGKNNKSLKCFGNRPVENITYEDVIHVLEKDGSIVRKISDNITIKKGKYGDYAFYKTTKMKKPSFYKITEFDNDYMTCDVDMVKNWLYEKYSIV